MWEGMEARTGQFPFAVCLQKRDRLVPKYDYIFIAVGDLLYGRPTWDDIELHEFGDGHSNTRCEFDERP